MTKAGFALTHPLRVARLSSKVATTFNLTPDAAIQAALANELGVSAIQKLTFRGTVTPVGRHDFTLQGKLVARVVQPCVVSLQPVVTDLAETVLRRYVQDYVDPSSDEAEAPDDTVEPLPEVIDLGLVAAEALALALPEYPRVAGAVFATPDAGDDAKDDVDEPAPKPFAGLADLAAKLARKAPDADDTD
jgi:uncharacterized metal-binding protein YceD (DUF177 family)